MNCLRTQSRKILIKPIVKIIFIIVKYVNLKNKDANDDRLIKSQREFEVESILQSLTQQVSSLKAYLSDLDQFGEKFSSLKDFLITELDWDNLLAETTAKKIRHISQDLNSALDNYARLRDKLARRMSQSNDLFALASALFEQRRSTNERPIIQGRALFFALKSFRVVNLNSKNHEMCSFFNCGRIR